MPVELLTESPLGADPRLSSSGACSLPCSLDASHMRNVRKGGPDDGIDAFYGPQSCVAADEALGLRGRAAALMPPIQSFQALLQKTSSPEADGALAATQPLGYRSVRSAVGEKQNQAGPLSVGGPKVASPRASGQLVPLLTGQGGLGWSGIRSLTRSGASSPMGCSLSGSVRSLGGLLPSSTRPRRPYPSSLSLWRRHRLWQGPDDRCWAPTSPTSRAGAAFS
jgi:hypothetical protein